jgi:iron complex outermembrane receptor protein
MQIIIIYIGTINTMSFINYCSTEFDYMTHSFLRLPLYCAMFTLASIANSAHATAANAEMALDKQLVTATRTAEGLASLPYTVQIVDSAEIAQQASSGQELGGILGQLVPGLGAGDNSVSNYYQSLRGRGVLVLIDGVAQRSNRGVSRQLSTISPSSIDRIEVISGATAIYGAGATGGVINIITKKAVEDGLTFHSEIGMTANTEDNDSNNHSYSLAQNIAGQFNKFDFLAGISMEQRGNYVDSNGDRIATDPNQLARDNTDTLDVIFNAGYQLTDTSKVRAGVQYFDEEMDTNSAADFGKPSAAYIGLPQGVVGKGGDYKPEAIEGLKLSQQPSTNRKSITLDFNEEDFFGQNLIAQASYRKQDLYFYPYLGAPLYIQTNWNQAATLLGQGATTTQALFGSSAAGSTITQSRIETTTLDFKVALDSQIDLAGKNLGLTYGFDYIQDKGNQSSIEYNYNEYLASGQTTLNKTGVVVNAGPETKTETQAAFLQAQFSPIDDLTLRAGIRHERIKAKVDDFISGDDVLNAKFYNSQLSDPTLQGLAAANSMTPEVFLAYVTGLEAEALKSIGADAYLKYSDTASTRKGGNKNFEATLLNAGAVYDINNAQQIYLSYGQGFTVPDITRLLRNVSIFTDTDGAQSILESNNIDAIKTNSWDLGWRGQFNNIELSAAGFFNRSDKSLFFNPTTGEAELLNQEEEIWGFEGLVNTYLTDNINTGATYSYTRGKTRGNEGGWISLPAERISPQKITAHLGYQVPGVLNTRLQSLHLSDYKEANREGNSATMVPFVGYTTFDLITSFVLPKGTLGISIRNLTNREYKHLYNQVRGYPSTGASSDLPAQGRTLSMNYSIDY